MDRTAASSIRMVQQDPAPFLGWIRFLSEMLCKKTEETVNLVFLRRKICSFSQILHKSQHYWELSLLLLQVKIILMWVSRRKVPGTALGYLPWQNFPSKSRLCSELTLIIFTSDLGNGVESIPFKHADDKWRDSGLSGRQIRFKAIYRTWRNGLEKNRMQYNEDKCRIYI